MGEWWSAKILNGGIADLEYLIGRYRNTAGPYLGHDLHKFLLEHPENANCIFHLAQFYRFCPSYKKSTDEIRALYQQTAALGHKGAKYQCAVYETDNPDYETLIELIRNGYDPPYNKEDLEDDIDIYFMLSKLLIKKYDEKVLELEYLPPGEGGSQYKAAKARFESQITR